MRTSFKRRLGFAVCLLLILALRQGALAQTVGKVTDVKVSLGGGAVGTDSNARPGGAPGLTSGVSPAQNLTGIGLAAPTAPEPALRQASNQTVLPGLPAPVMGAPRTLDAAPPALPAPAVGSQQTQQTLQAVQKNAADVQAILAEPAQGDQAADRAAGLGSRVFDRGGGKRAAGAQAVDAGFDAPVSADIGPRPTGLSSHWRRPYQVQLARLHIPLSLIARLDEFVAGRHSGPPSRILGGLGHAVRTANIMSVLAADQRTGMNAEYASLVLILAALLRDSAPAADGAPDIGASLKLLREDPAAVSLLKEFESRKDLTLEQLYSIIAYSADQSDPAAQQVAKSLADQGYGMARHKLWAQRWGPRLAFAHDIAVFVDGFPLAAKAARELAQERRSRSRPATDREAFSEAAQRLRSLMDGPYFSLLTPGLRANAQDALDRFTAEAGLPPPSAAVDENARGRAPPGPRPDSAVEIEINTYPEILKLLTTPDGTLRPLLRDIPLPEHFPGHAVPGGLPKDIQDLEWARLTPEDQLSLLQHVSQYKRTDFFTDRRVPGVTIRRRAVLKFKKETRFLGKTYAPGRHLVDVSQALRSKVEYRGPTEVKAVSGLELHFRDNQPAGEVSNDAWKFLDALGVRRTHQHIHMVAPLPRQALEAEPELQAAVMGDFYRRVNLLAEMTDIIDEGGSIGLNQTKRWDWKYLAMVTTQYFGALTKKDLLGVTQYFRNVGHRRDYPIEDSFKMAWVGFRGSDKYDTPGLYGLEYRAISDYSNETEFREMLGAIQGAMLSNDFGIPQETMRRWLAERTGAETDAPEAVAKLWYGRSWPELFAQASTPVRRELGWWTRTKLRWNPGSAHIELKMLVHDWSDDPLVFDDEAFKARLIGEQKRALARIRRGESINRVMGDFLMDSGLYEAVSRSLGLLGRRGPPAR